MNLFKLLILAAAVWFAWRLLRGVRVQIHRAGQPRKPDEFEKMARCASCGVHLPASALSSDGRCGKCRSSG